MMMDAGIRSSEASRSVVKSRNSSGCLIIRKKVDGMGGAGASGLRKVLEPTKEKKRPRLVLSDSGSSDEVSEPPRRKVTSREDRCDNGFKTGVVIESELRRKRIERVADELMSKRASNKLNVSDFDIYDGYKRKQPRKEYLDDVRTAVGGNGYLKASVVSGSGREFHDGSGRQDIVYKRKNSHFVSPNAVVGESGRGSDHAVRNRHEMKRDGAKVPGSLFKENLMDVSDVPIRFQGKNGVLKVMPNKKKGSGIMKTYDRRRPEENKRGSSSSNAITPSGLIQPSLHSETKMSKKETSFVKSENNMLDIQDSLPTNKSNSRDRGSEDSGKSLKRTKNVEDHKHLSGKSLKRTKNVEDHKHSKLMKKSKDKDLESGDSGKSLKLRRKKAKDQQSLKMSKDQAESAPASDKALLSSGKEVKIKRGSGTEKQQLREQIRKMLIDAGWTIDYRPRRNRDYQDAVYVSPFGTAYWSIIKAYDALQKHFKEENSNSKTRGECPFIPISEQVLSKLTRQTRKKIEKQMKKRHLDGNKIKNLQGTTANEVESSENDSESVDSDEAEEKLSSFIKHGCKSLKSRLNGDTIGSPNNECQSIGHNSHEENRSNVQGRQSRKLGRCTLLVRNTNKVLNSETDGYIPYTGKRTVLSWLIDSGTVELREKVQYMNRQNTRIKLVGWITRDGIHCGCCSKILTVARFEIHAGSKLHQPFQYICLESGISLLQCQIDAWNRQEESKRCNFHTIDVDGDDPNDDTCGICGDGGDLICCDGCPSTYHQNCLGIHMLPAGDWHCPNCTCKFCGMAGEGFGKGIDITGSTLIMCSLCERKYHQSCSHDVGPLPSKTTELCPSFCGHKCKELFEQVQKFLGVRHELESGFSWSLVHRLDINSDASGRCLPQRVECNSKLAVALTVMDECFLPIVDRRGGINVIHNVLYNCGSNFNRLNYGGFYTAILERGDEILSAASLRFHGTQLAEMPFIGTRHIYRRQGMCRRLFRAIESALRSFKVEKLVIPAVSELMHTWTGVFGFKPLEESDKKEIGSLNLLVFPDIDMLQKHLTEPTNTMQSMTLGRGAKTLEVEGKQFGTPCSLGEPDEGTPTKEDRNNANMREADGINGKVVASDPGRTLGNISALFGPPNASSQEARPPTSDEEDVLFPSRQTKSLAAEAAVKSVHQLPTWISQAVPGEQTDLPLCSSSQGDTQSTLQGGFESNFHSLERSSSHAGDDKSDEIPRIKSKSLSPSDTTRSVSEMQKKSVLGSPDGEIVGHEDASVLRSSAEISASKMEEIVRP